MYSVGEVRYLPPCIGWRGYLIDLVQDYGWLAASGGGAGMQIELLAHEEQHYY